ncbi:hypothetical protein SAMN02745248_01141 [Hathewaya proteolytica DSM 3090]|uniref:Uncharacterized protein n=1 Tax=Hathewaya proteolytica DSM 3090 TaxID=1121331 RepID=A0A1M6MS75_9CLOT|nr:hypothetical protein [Hathewaya proteolytica]SHJ86240.1 hypothetical protein SAMN02745248_01141 [Hathewaya proteolytica DSM 3090]
MSKVVHNIVKIFLIFVVIIVILGFLVLSVNKQMLMKVQISNIRQNDEVDCSVRLNGEVKPKYTFNVVASKDIEVEKSEGHNGEILEEGQLLMKLKNTGSGFSKDVVSVDLISKEKNVKNEFSLKNTGECTVKHRVYLNFINENPFISAGDIIMTYSFYANNDDLYIECSSKKGQISEEKLKVATIDRQSADISIIKKEQYLEHDIFKFANKSESIMAINRNVDIEIKSSRQFRSAVPKTAFIQDPYKLNEGYLYVVNKTKSVLGDGYTLKKVECKKLYECDEFIDCGDVFVMDNSTEGVVMYPTPDMKESQRVQIDK